MPGPHVSPVARSVPLDNVGSDYAADNVRDALIEIDFREVTKEPTGHVDRVQSTVSFNETTRTFTIEPNTPTYSSFVFYIRGRRFEKTAAESVVIGNLTGGWFIYYDNTGTLVASQTPWSFTGEQAFVFYIYWHASHSHAPILGEERHGLAMDWSTHARLHNVVGTQVEPESFMLGDYILRGDGSLDAHVQFSVTDGILWDEDIEMEVSNGTPNTYFEQTLNPIANVPVLYKENGSGEWHRTTPSAIPVAYNATGLQYNYYDSGTDTWSLENVTDGYYVTYWLIATNSIDYPIMIVAGQAQAENAITAASSIDINELLTGLPVTEVVGLYKLIYKYDSTYTNAPKAILYATAGVLDVDLDIDRYNFPAVYGGNANTGRVLEITPNVDSLDAPFRFPEDSYIRTVTFHSAANTANASIGFYDENDLVTPVFELNIPGPTNEEQWDLSEFFPSGFNLVIIVSGGAISKPSLRIWVQTAFN